MSAGYGNRSGITRLARLQSGDHDLSRDEGGTRRQLGATVPVGGR